MDYSTFTEFVESIKTLALSEQAQRIFAEIMIDENNRDEEIVDRFVEKMEGDPFVTSVVAGILCNYFSATEQL